MSDSKVTILVVRIIFVVVIIGIMLLGAWCWEEQT